jgi:hypothetical protein
MAPLTHLDEMERAAVADSRPVSAPQTPHVLTEADRQGLAMGWVAITLGMLLLLGGLALWAAWAFSAGFGAWLLAVGVMGLVMVALVVAVNYVVMRPSR